jgi:hypothetical protein
MAVAEKPHHAAICQGNGKSAVTGHPTLCFPEQRIVCRRRLCGKSRLLRNQPVPAQQQAAYT